MEFERTRRLIGNVGTDKLRNATVMVLGVGGVGGHCIEALARCGVGHLILVDPDKVSETNINRQLVALHSTIGKLKTKVMEERIHDISPEIKVTTYETFILNDNLSEIFEVRPDYIIDAIDTVTAKLALAEYAQEEGIPIISAMGTGNKLDPSRFEITDISKTSICPLCKVMRRECKKWGIRKLTVLFSKEEPIVPAETTEVVEGKRAVPGSISFVPSVAGLMLAGHVIRELSGVK